MRKAWDVIFYDTVGTPYDGNTPRTKGMGASEHQVIMLAEELAARGRRVLVLNTKAGHMMVRGVRYGHFADLEKFREGHTLRCTSLIICRYSPRPLDIAARQVVVWATDVPGDAYQHHINGGTIVALSEWHAGLFGREYGEVKVIPLAVPDDLYPSPIPQDARRRFVYASAALKGLKETLRLWHELWEDDGRELRVCLPGYDNPATVDDAGLNGLHGVQFLGSIAPARVIEQITNSAGLFYVNTFQETFCVTAALAEALGRRVHILCTGGSVGIAGLSSAVSSPLVTRDREQFVIEFRQALGCGNLGSYLAHPRPVRMSSVMKHWEKFLLACPEAWRDAANGPFADAGDAEEDAQLEEKMRMEVEAKVTREKLAQLREGEKLARLLKGTWQDMVMPPREPARARLALCMIVKNEAKVIRRALASVKGIVDCYAIIDTGSTDDTMAILRDELVGKATCRLESRPWVDFATNRNQALELAATIADYALVLDADDLVEVKMAQPGETFRDFLLHGDPDSLELEVRDGETTYRRTQIVRVHPDKGFRYKWPVHESLVCTSPDPVTKFCPALVYVRGAGGARQRSSQTYVDDANVLAEWLKKQPADARATYYLGQSWEDAAKRADAEKEATLARRYRENAIAAYTMRGRMMGWDQEKYVALWHAGNLELLLDRGQEATLRWLEAVEADPARAETLWELSRYHARAHRFALGMIFGEAAVARRTCPEGALFAFPSVYQWEALDWLAVCCVRSPSPLMQRRGLDMLETLLCIAPASEHARLRDNVARTVERIP